MIIPFLVWLTLSWQPTPDAVNYRVEASQNCGRTWQQVVSTAMPNVKIPIADELGVIMLRLTVLDAAGNSTTEPVEWRFDPNTGITTFYNTEVE